MVKSGHACVGAILALLAGASAASADVLYSNTFESGPLGSEWSAGAKLDQHASFSRFNGRYSNGGVTLTLGAVPPPGGATGHAAGQIGGGSHVGIGGGGKGGGGGGDDGGDGDGDGDGGGDGGGDGDGGGEDGSPYILYTLEFDLYTIDSWDGEGKYGPDVFEVRANGPAIFHETFSNGLKPQSFRRPDVGPEHLGYGSSWKDSIYRDIRVDFTIPEDAQSISIRFEGMGLQGLVDESWGIDNIGVSYEVRYGPIPAPATLGAGAVGMVAVLGRRRRRA